MACTVVYKGQTFSEPDFIDYVKNNFSEFKNKVPTALNREINSPKFTQELVASEISNSSLLGGVAASILPNLSQELQDEVASKYGANPTGPEFSQALTREITDVLFNKIPGELNSLATQELTKAFAQLTQNETLSLDGLERSIYNLITGQQTKFHQYPKVKNTEIAFPSEEGWQIFDRTQLLDQAKNGEIDIDSIPGLATFLAVEMMYEDKVNTEETPVDYTRILSERAKGDMSKKLLSILERLGFSTIKLSDYIQAHNMRHGMDPSVNALADLAKRIVAISENGNTEELLSEEVAHILTETYNNQDEIRAILPEVENTDVWAQHAANYYRIYEGKGLTTEQLTEKVRREILGKLIAEKLTENQSAEPTTLFGRIGSIVNKFFNSIKTRLKPSIKGQLNTVINRIAESAIQEEKLNTMFNAENLTTNPFGEFYNAEESVITAQLGVLLSNSRKLLSKNRGGNLSAKVETLSTMVASNSLDSIQTARAISQYLDITNAVKRDVTSKVKNYEEAVKNGRTPKTFLSSMENASVNILITENLPHLQTLAAALPHLEAPTSSTQEATRSFNKYKKKLSIQLDSLITEINTLKGEVLLKNTVSGQSLLEEMVQTYNLSETAAQEIRDYLRVTHNDITALHGFFGNLQNAPNPILGLFSRLIGDIHHKSDMATKNYSRTFIDLTKKLGIPQSGLQSFFDRLIQKTPDGKLTGFLQGVIDWGKFDAERKAVEIRAYNTANEKFIEKYNQEKGGNLVFEPIQSIDEIGTKPNTPRISEFTGGIKEAYNDEINEWRDQNLEQPYNVSFREERKNMINEIRTKGIQVSDGTLVTHIPPKVEDLMAGWAKERSRIKGPYIKNGIMDYSALPEADKNSLDDIKRDRLNAKSLVDSITGELKTGEERDIALALQAIEQYYVQKNTSASGTRTLRQEFIDALNKFTNNNDAFNWFTRNSGFTFNDKFWSRMDSAAGTASDKFRAAISQASMPASDKLDALDKAQELEDLMKKRSQFLKQFKNPTSPAEVDTQLMSQGAMSIYLGMEADIERLFSELNGIVSLVSSTTVSDIIQTESTSNESFERDFEDAKREDPTLDLFKFASNHMTENNYTAARAFEKATKAYEKTRSLAFTKSLQKSMKKSLGLSSDATDVELKGALDNYIDNNGGLTPLVESYLKGRLAGYYKRFAPKGFGKFYEMLKSGNIVDTTGKSHTLAEIITAIREGDTSRFPFENDIMEYLEVNPEVEWMEDESQLERNPNFIQNSDTSTFYGGYGQPRMDKYLNQEFINKYNIDLNLYKTTGETKSNTASPELQKELSMLEFLVHSRHNNFRQQGVDNAANAYSIPGVRKAAVAKTKDFFTNPIQATREWYDDFVANSVDKKIFGESISGELDNDTKNIDNLVVPLLNVQPLERLEDTATDLLYSYTVHAYNANLYAHRQEAFTKANQLEAILLSRDFKDKAAKDSTAHKTFQDFKKAYLLGVQETKRIKVGIAGRSFDATNLLRTFDRALGTVNVGLNPAVSVTAGASALTFSVTEALVGQYINPKSYQKGVARFHSKAGSFLSETGDLDRTNEIYLFGEKFGLYGMLNGVENSGEGKFIRALMKDGITGVAHIMTEIATKPFAPSAMYAVMDDHRMVKLTAPNGAETHEIMTFVKFKQIKKAAGKTNAEIESQWKALEPFSVLNNLEIKDSKVEFSQKFNDILSKTHTTPEALAEAKNTIEMEVKNMVSTVVSRIDAKMPLYDKSVASRNALARFLLRHREWFTINFQNRFKRGHENLYTGQYEEGHYHTLVRFALDSFKAFSPRHDETMREVFENLTDAEKMNLKRVLIDTSISLVLALVGGFIIRPWGDDEENKDNWKVQFLSYMYYRLASEQMSSGIAGIPSYKDVLESPIVAVNSVKEIMKPSNWSTKPVEDGPYEGHSKLFKLIAKNTFARHYYDLVYGLQKKSDFYRLNNEWTLLTMQKISKKEKEAQRKYEEELKDSYSLKTEKFVR